MGLFEAGVTGDRAGIIEHLLAGGEMVASQLPAASGWSAERKLAAAVLSGALIEIRDHSRDRSFRRQIAEDAEWVFSDERDWPFSFLSLCEFFDLDPAWVRSIVNTWLQEESRPVDRQGARYRHAA
jgi:hypothetical protein